MQRSTAIVRRAHDDSLQTTAAAAANEERPTRLRRRSEPADQPGVTAERSPQGAGTGAASIAENQDMAVSRQHSRLRTSVRAVLYSGSTFQTTVIRDISLGGIGLSGAEGLFLGEPVKITLLSGASKTGVVRWWLGGCCGVQFDKPLTSDDPFFVTVERRGGASRG